MFKKCLAEFLGTAFLVLFGCGVAAMTGSYLGTAFAFGFALMIGIYAFGSISGGHFNPAVSLAFAVEGKISWKEFGLYVLSQVLGAFVGVIIIGLLCNNFASVGGNEISQRVLAIANTEVHANTIGLLAEMVLTFVFVLFILCVTRTQENKLIAGLLIGIALTLVHLFGIGITGTSVNPARSFAPAVVQAIAGKPEAIKEIWIYLVGPLCGATLAAFTFEGLFTKKKETKDDVDNSNLE